MKRSISTSLFALVLCWIVANSTTAQEPPKEPTKEPPKELLGVWQAISMTAGGREAPPEAVKQMRFTFKKDELLVRGNFGDEREESCKFKVDPAKTPKHLEFSPPKERKPVLGIYRIEKGKLEICIRNANQPKGRPESFEKTNDESIVHVVFERVEAEQKK